MHGFDPRRRSYTAAMLVEREIVLPVPPAEAWAVLMDWERQADWMLDADRVTVVSEQREGVGVRLAVRTRILGFPAFTEPMEVTGWDAADAARDPARLARGRHRHVDARAPSTAARAFTWREDIRLALPVVGELAATLYRPVMRVLMGRAMQGLRAHLIATGPARS